jgi:SAM-dependent methyltransferase
MAECDQYELANLFLDLFRNNQPVLEAGCGSGRWCGWFVQNDIQSDGIDWSNELCQRAQREIPKSRFIPCDMQQLPFKDSSYGGLIALGSIEHNPDGPMGALKEFHRVLQPESVAVITVPFGGSLRRIMRFLSRPIVAFKSNALIRHLFGKRVPVGATLAEAKQTTRVEWHPQFTLSEKGWYFYEYEFNAEQMRTLLTEAKLLIVREFVGFGNEGVLHNFGSLAGRWNEERNDVDFTVFGRLLRKTIPVSVCGHMLCYVVQKPAQG